MNGTGKLNFLGVGPRIALVLLPWLTVSIILSSIYHEIFSYISGAKNFLLIPGIVLMLFALIFYFSTVRLLLSGLRETKLVTTGPYSACQNPLYFSIVVLFIPALSLLLNSWLVLSTSIVGYLLFIINIKKEYNELEKFFGESYIKYRNETPEFFPLSPKKWLHGDK
jgi:protein-S-isoprenylcysteine O-methyltransferase Ste14